LQASAGENSILVKEKAFIWLKRVENRRDAQRRSYLKRKQKTHLPTMFAVVLDVDAEEHQNDNLKNYSFEQLEVFAKRLDDIRERDRFRRRKFPRGMSNKKKRNTNK
jgi:hypothetical protein